MDNSASLQHKANLDLAQRTRWSTLTFLLLFAIILGFTSYSEQQPIMVYVIGVLLVLGTLSRMYLSFRFDTIYQKSPRLWNSLFVTSIVLLALTWGLFCMVTIVYYQLSWASMLLILATAGLAAGATSTLSILYYQIVIQLSLMLLPTVFAALFMASRESIAVALMFTIYFCFLLLIAKRHNNEYWSALNTTEQLKLYSRELESSNQELESYSYSIAHDLRAPLRSIVSFTQILLSESRHLKQEERETLARVVNASKFMARLIDDILNLSRITRVKLDKNTVDISQLAKRYINLLRETEPGHSVNCIIQPNMLTEGDTRLLYIAIQNLIDNSWKFTHNSSNAPRIEIGSEVKDDKTIYYVKDNGIGFNEEYSNRIFSPFERLNSDYDGTGIGLATVARVVHRHGGEVWAESKNGEGSTFYFTLKSNEEVRNKH